MEMIVCSHKNSVETVGSPHLPEDVIFEILTRVSLETLERCMLVCQKWDHIICNPKFMKLYRERNNIFSGFLLQRHQELPDVLDFLPALATIQAVSNQGLVYCESPTDQTRKKHYVCKPTTREWVKIPNPKTRFTTHRTGMVVLKSRPLHYKILRLSEPQDDSCYRTLICEVFDSEKGAWKRLENINKSWFRMWQGPPVFSCGAFHWLTEHDQTRIFAFDIYSEQWQLIHLSENLIERSFDKRKSLLQYKGKLAFLIHTMDEDKVEIWVMENYSRRSWKLAREIENIKYLEEEIVHLYADDVVVVRNRKPEYNLIWYDFQNGTSVATRLNDFVSSHQIYPFESDHQPMFSCDFLRFVLGM